MKPVYTSEWGQCFTACAASILELPLSEMPIVPTHIEEFSARFPAIFGDRMPTNEEIIPHLGEWIEETRDRYNREFNKIWSAWFAERNLICTMLKEMPKGYCIASGRYKEFSHALVLLDGKPVHDPEGFPADAPEVPWEYDHFYVIEKAKP